MSRIGFIGTGHIAAPMARFLSARGHDLWVTERSRTESAALAQNHGAQVGDAQDVLDNSDIIFLCLRPTVAAGILASLTFREDHQVASVMAGISLPKLADICAPVQKIVRSIPYGFLENGGCPLASVGDISILKTLFEPENPVLDMGNEENMRAAAASSGMIAGYLDMLANMAEWMGAKTGKAEVSEIYTTQLFAGFLQHQKQGLGELAKERDTIASPGTLNLLGLDTLRANKADASVEAALNAIHERLTD